MFFIAMLSLQMSVIVAQDWTVQYTPRLRHIHNIHAIDPTTIIATGGNESNDSITTIVRSMDGGLDWRIILDNIGPWLMWADYINDTTAIACGFDGVMIRTDDLWENFEYLSLPGSVSHRNFYDIKFIDENTGIAVGGNKENDAIETIIKTEDGGTSWSIISDRMSPCLRSVCFIDNTSGFLVGNSGTILKTNDQGDTWIEIIPPETVEGRDFHRVYFQDEHNGWIVGGQYGADSLQTMIKTVNGGETWEVILDRSGPPLNDICFINQDIAFIVGDDETVLQSSDGGLSWVQASIPDLIGPSDFKCVFFLNSRFGLIGGTWGTLLKYNPDYFSVEELYRTKSVRISPNPFRHQAVIECDNEMLNRFDHGLIFTVYSIDGKKVDAISIDQSSTIYRNSRLTPGIYFYCLRSGNSLIDSGKFIVRQ